MKKRKILPIVIIPLDQFGEALAKSIEEEINLTEPELLKYHWLRILPIWSKASSNEIVQSISDSSILNKISDDTPYQSAVNADFVYTIIIGSQSLSSEIIGSLETFSQELKKEKLFESLRILTILDISQMPNEDQKTEKSDLKNLKEALDEIEWPDYVYLVQNKSEIGLRANRREEISEAIRLFIEGVVLGDLWEDYADNWLNRRATDKNRRFASFSVFSLSSAQAELIKYFSHVSFYEVFDLLSEQTEYNPEIPELGEVNTILSNNHKAEGGIRNSNIQIDQNLKFDSGLKPRMLETKSSFWDRMTRAVDDFKVSYHHKSNELRERLVSDGKDLRESSDIQLNKFTQRINDKVRSVLSENNFCYKVQNLEEEFTHKVESISNSDESYDVEIPKAINLDAKFEPDIKILLGLIKRLPNPTSLLLIAGITLLMQILITFRLVNLLDIGSQARMIMFWVGLVLWLAGGIYISWRIPAWRIKHFIEEKIERISKDISGQLYFTYQDLLKSLSNHLNNKNLASKRTILAVLSRKLKLTYKVFEKSASQEKSEYPFPDIPLEKVRPSASPFLKYLESEKEISLISKSIHRESIEFVPSIKSQANKIFSSITSEEYKVMLNLIMREIRGIYAETKFEIPKNLVDRIKIAKQGWQGHNDKPLLNIDATAKPGMSEFYCACDEGWTESLERALEIVYTKATIINLKPKDRIYFYKTFYSIPLDRIHL